MTITYFIILAASLAAVLGFDALGAILSRKININYGNLSMISLLLYLLIGFVSATYINTTAAITIAGLVGLVDTVVGWQIAKKLNANVTEEQQIDLLETAEPPVFMVVSVVLMSMGTGWLGALFV